MPYVAGGAMRNRGLIHSRPLSNMFQLRRRILLLSLALGLASALPVQAAGPTPQVLLKTSMGDIVLELYPDKAPKSVENFIAYVKAGHYNGTVFHRVINGFMIQGGGYDRNGTEKSTREPVQNEAGNGLRNDRGWISMARTSAPHSATAQFFINVVDNDRLNYPSFDGWGYATFGKVIKGMDVVDKIKSVPTGARDVPQQPVIIQSATLVN
jgi:cyclophilin family peptidyl-prolyl cis-trans isomerase